MYRSDKKLRKILAREKENVPTKKIAFDTFTDIKSEIGPLTIKPEPTWEMEIEVPQKPVETMDGKDIVIAQTVIRKVDPNAEEVKVDNYDDDDVQLTWRTTRTNYPTKSDPDVSTYL